MAAALSLSVLTACGQGAAPAASSGTEKAAEASSGEKSGETLVVYTARSESLNNVVIEGFEAATGIKVDIVTGGTGEVLKRVQSEAANPQGDILWAADESMLSSYSDLFESYVSPEDAGMKEAYHNKTGFFSPAFSDPTVFIVNKDLAEGMEINGFADLLNPELKGKIAFGDPVNSSSAFQILTAALYDMGKGDPMSAAAWEYVDAFLKNLDGVVLDSSSQVYKGVAEGEYIVGLTWEDPVAAYVRDGVSVKVVFPEEGAIMTGQAVEIIKGAPHMDNAKKFVDYMLSDACQSDVGQNLTVRPLRDGASMNEFLTPWEDITATPGYDADWVAANKAMITETYTEHLEKSMD